MIYIRCLICGCGFFNKEVITNVTLFKKIFPYEKWHHKYNEEPELLIENTSNDEDIDKLSSSIRIIQLYDWLEKIVAITPTGLVDITNVEDNSHRLVFFDNNDNEYDPYWVNDKTYKQKPYIMHKSCYQLLKKNGYDMSYNSFLDVDNPEKLKIKKKGSKDFNENIELNKFNIDYGIVNKYIGEYKNMINYVAYIYDKYLLENPLKNKINATRILELKFPLKKIQTTEVKEVKRKGPSDSATIFDIGTTKIGNDNHMWTIVKNKNGVKKWQRIKQEGKLNNSYTNSTYYYKYIKYKTKYYNLIKKLETN